MREGYERDRVDRRMLNPSSYLFPERVCIRSPLVLSRAKLTASFIRKLQPRLNAESERTKKEARRVTVLSSD